mmetsp:Transcript_19836/g.44737  ORF Transcript_19836/g.44737 Transcript_19836/m.44737 type:complete len:82 (-) Transcript_19836:119-364(-)
MESLALPKKGGEESVGEGVSEGEGECVWTPSGESKSQGNKTARQHGSTVTLHAKSSAVGIKDSKHAVYTKKEDRRREDMET